MENSVAMLAEWPTEKLLKENLSLELLKNNKNIPAFHESKNAKFNLSNQENSSKIENSENIHPKRDDYGVKPKVIQQFKLSKKRNSCPKRSLKESDSMPGIVFKLFPTKVISEIAPQTHKPVMSSLFVLKGNGCIAFLKEDHTESQYLCAKDAESHQYKNYKNFNSLPSYHNYGGGSNSNSTSNIYDHNKKQYFSEDGNRSERNNKGGAYNSSNIIPVTYSSSVLYRKGLYDRSNANHSILHNLKAISRRISASGPVEGRACGSCNVMKTPYWRDGWDQSIMLCNACGLRYQKFKKRCSSCKYVPRKEDGECPRCTQCNNIWI